MEQIGVYNLAYQLFKGVVALTLIVGFYFLPFVSQNINNSEKMRDYLYRKRPRVLLLGVIGIAVFALIGPWFISWMYSGKYEQAGPILMVLVIGAVFNLYSLFYHSLYSAAKIIKYIQIFTVVQVLLNVLLNIVLIPKFGLMGAAMATVTAYAVKAVMYELHFRKQKLLLLRFEG
jgi:O-antigen/teichoic acid export membrane protein